MLLAGIACFAAGLVVGFILQNDSIIAKDNEIRQLKSESEDLRNALYHKPEIINHEAYKPNIEVIDIPQADRTYHMPW